MTVKTITLPFDTDTIAIAAKLVAAGEPVAIASETVYGLAADATSGEAVAQIYAAKGRPSFNPLIVHVADLVSAQKIALFPPAALRLAEHFWPGPLTMVLQSRADTPIAALATAGLTTIAIRISAHPAMRALIAASDRPLAAPSANASGLLSPTRAEHVRASLDGRIPLIIDAGPTHHGLESTIVAVGADELRLLRPGPIEPQRLEKISGLPILLADSGSLIEAPGQLASHYAPSKPLRLNATIARPSEWLIGFGKILGNDSLSTAGILTEAASRLFDALHRADTEAATGIAIAPIPGHGLGLAINDRLARASIPGGG